MGLPVFVGATAQSTIFKTATPTNVSIPAGSQVGDLLIMVITEEQSSGSSLTLPSGWSVIVRNTTSSVRDSIVIAAGIHTGGSTYPVSNSTVLSRVRTLCYRDVNPTTPVTASAIKLIASSNPNTSTALTVTEANSLELVVAANVEQVATSVTGAAGMTSRINSATYVSLDASDAAVSVGTTPVRTVTIVSTLQRAIANLVIAGTGGGGTTPITFTGTIPAQSATVGVPFSLDVTSYFTGTQTPFTYAIQSGTFPAGLSLSGSTISGTPTGAEAQAITIRGTDASSNTADSNSFTITVAAAGSPPSGTFTVGTITTTQTTASVPYTYSAADQTSIQYRINGGTAVTASASPQSLTGLTASTTYGIEFRAVNSFGNGSWSTSASFTTQSAVVTGTFTTGVLRKLVGGAVLANTALTYFRLYNPTTGALVLNRTDLSTDANGRVTCVDAAITAGVDYKADWLAATGETRMSKKAAT